MLSAGCDKLFTMFAPSRGDNAAAAARNARAMERAVTRGLTQKDAADLRAQWNEAQAAFCEGETEPARH